MKTIIPFLLITILLNHTAMAQEKKIIFVCEHGAAKSVIAASYFNKMAKERNLKYTAECRGISPDSVISPGAREGLTKDNMFDPARKPQKLQSSDTANVERVILFTALTPTELGTGIKTENWSAIQNVNADYEKRRDAIVKKINELLDSLENK
jgi:arsenate reductase (thioredoxin)